MTTLTPVQPRYAYTRARPAEATRSNVRSAPRSPRWPTAASSACQIAIAARPTLIAITRYRPNGCRTELIEGAALVAGAGRLTEGDLQGEPRHQQVHQAVPEEPDAGQLLQDRAVRGAAGGPGGH